LRGTLLERALDHRRVGVLDERNNLASIELPVSHPTCCCFGGPALDRLYVTSALEPLSESQRADEPLAGRVLELDPGICGRPEYRTGL